MQNIKKKCHAINLKLQNSKLQFQNFGNVSLRIDEKNFVIKPSGINVKKTKFYDFPVVNIDSKKSIGKLKPSSDTLTHLEIYKNFRNIRSIVHTHSKYAVIWSQSNKSIPNLGTTHADYWLNEIPITSNLKNSEIKKNYETNIGKKIVEKLRKIKNNVEICPGILVQSHGPFTWGFNHEDGFKNAERLELIAELAYKSLILNKNIKINKILIEKHFYRKHGKSKYYGQ